MTNARKWGGLAVLAVLAVVGIAAWLFCRQSPELFPANVPSESRSVTDQSRNWNLPELEDRLLSAKEKERLSAIVAERKRPMSSVESRQLAAKGILCNSTRNINELRRDLSVVHLRNAVIDTRVIREGGPGIDVPAAFRASPDTTHFIVQFESAPTEGQKEFLRSAGATIEHYIPHHAYAVSIPADRQDRLRMFGDVVFVEPFHPYFKMSAEVQAYLAGDADDAQREVIETGRYNVLLFQSGDGEKALEAMGARVKVSTITEQLKVARVECSPEKLYELVKNEAVKWVEARVPSKPANDLGARRMRAKALRFGHPDFDGSGVIAAVVDTGVDHNHRGFAVNPGLDTAFDPAPVNSRIVAYNVATNDISDSDGVIGDINGHGSHVAGSVLGNGAFSASVPNVPGSDSPYTTNQFAGVAPNARLVMFEDFNSFESDEIMATAYQQGARVMNNSWGNMLSDYGTMSAEWDALVRDANPSVLGRQHLSVFFAAGNSGGGSDDGTGGAAGTVGQPGNAKNVITIGALELVRRASNRPDANSVDMTDSDWQVASYSSRGPTPDGRVKPDVMAPGSYIFSVQSKDTYPEESQLFHPVPWDIQFGNVDSGTNYAASVGTSMATPLATGAGALLYQFYTNAYPGRALTPALMRALLINTATPLFGHMYDHTDPTRAMVSDGWGKIDIARAVDGALATANDQILYFDEADHSISATGDEDIYTHTVNSGERGIIKITIAWSDSPGAPGAGIALVNDLDLVVTAPDGGVYVGNYMGYNGWGSGSYHVDSYNEAVTDNLLDRINNTETVIIPEAFPGNYQVRVIGTTVPDAPQAFAMVISQGGGTYPYLPSGDDADLAFHADGSPVLVYANEGDEIDQLQDVGVHRWMGTYGDGNDFHRWVELRDKWFTHGFQSMGSYMLPRLEAAVLPPGCDADDCSVAVNPANDYVYTAFVFNSSDSNAYDSIYLRYFNGSQWLNLGTSYRDRGLCGSSTAYRNGLSPVVGVDGSGRPVVAYVQQYRHSGEYVTYREVVVKRWNGTAWVGMDGSVDGFVGTHNNAAGVDMVMDGSGNPVVTWKDTQQLKVKVYRWGGGSWGQLGQTLGTLLPSSTGLPKLAYDGGNFYVAWVELVANPLPERCVFVAQSSGGGWTGLGSSMTAGVSTNAGSSPQKCFVGSGHGELYVAWENVGGDGMEFYARYWDGSNWVGVDGSDQSPGLAVNLQEGSRYNTTLCSFRVSPSGLPTFAFVNTLSGLQYVYVYGLVGHTGAPIFGGLRNAVGTSFNTVDLSWLAAYDPQGDVTYHVYRSPLSWSPADSSIPSASDPATIASVFGNEVATVSAVTAHTVGGLTADRVWFWGVRAENSSGFMDANTVLKLTGPYSLVGDPDQDWLVSTYEINTLGTSPTLRDSDGDGMWDGWEWYYSTNNPAHATNLPAMRPMDNGDDNLLTTIANDGGENQEPYEDLDGDGLLNFEEFQYYTNNSWAPSPTVPPLQPGGTNNPVNWYLDPTKGDTDGDGMGDGWEHINGLDPTDPSDAAADADGDGLTNFQEGQLGTNPQHPDSDADGQTDGAEVAGNTDPTTPDSDNDGLMDGFEAAIGSDAGDADSNDDGVMDGDEYQLGFADPATLRTNFTYLLPTQIETFESGMPAGWSHRSDLVDLWHITTADPDKPFPRFEYFGSHSTNQAFRCAKDLTATNVWATYDMAGQFVISELRTPAVNPFAATVPNLYVSWNELYFTEAQQDLCVVQVSIDGLNWYVARSGVSGVQSQWVHRVADISSYKSMPSVRVRFLFRTLNNINNAFQGWWVDDVAIYGARRITGTVRDENGAPLQGATVYAMGAGKVWTGVDGHLLMLPGKIFGQAITDTYGRYIVDQLPKGKYYVKATYTGYRSEFWNGVLYTNGTFHQAFGQALNPGVPEVRLVNTNSGLADMVSTATRTCSFELEGGTARGSLIVLSQQGGETVYLNQAVTNTPVWNTSTATNAWGNVPYVAATSGTLNYPDWETNVVQPTGIGDLAEGLHDVYLYPGQPSYPLHSLPEIPVRDGEQTVIMVATNQSSGLIYVKSTGAGSHRVYVDGRDTGQLTTGSDVYTIVTVGIGLHDVELIPTTTVSRVIAPQRAYVPVAGRDIVEFTTNDIVVEPGSMLVQAVDIRGGTVTNAEVFINGRRLTTNNTEIGQGPATPVTITELCPGDHWISLRKNGYRVSERRSITVRSGISNSITVLMYAADRDYDQLSDAEEILSYGNIAAYSRSGDADGDTLDNKLEADQYRLTGVRLNLFDRDSDHDGMLDNIEMGYDGQTNMLGFSYLPYDVDTAATVVDVYFAGRFLTGINAFNTAAISGGNKLSLSLDGDQVRASAFAWTSDTFGTPILRFTVPGAGAASNVVSRGHIFSGGVFSDPFPNNVDSDGDGMWDGFEYQFRHVGLNPLDSASADEDPDSDGLNNIDEFLGRDGIANTNDWCFPDDADSDNDFMPDGWEMDHALNPRDPSDASADPDSDILTNLQEWQNMTDPYNPDSDTDQLIDGLEVLLYGTNPLSLDSDLDGLFDGEEVWDSDRDPENGIDGGFFPNWSGGDIDNDGNLDGPTDWDTDGDGMPDGFEVKNAWGETRPADGRLDPENPSDAQLDFDGDGLSNLDEYLVRDALTGNHPSSFNPMYAAEIWDYPTDPFDGDSDDDGMPDGYEVWYGLYPVDPMRDPGTGLFTAVRSLDLWLFGDLDFDAVANINEYTVRFLLDPGVDPLVLPGSAHPWNPDSDGDGLRDGEEIKTFRSSPLAQDTDLDGIADGTRVLDRPGEVKCGGLPVDDNNYDRALNDHWRLGYTPAQLYPRWQMVTNSSSPPSPRWGGAAALISYSVIDSTSGEYVGQPVSGVPGGDLGTILLNNSAFVLFGGQTGVDVVNEIWYLTATGWVFQAQLPVLDEDWIRPLGIAAATRQYAIDLYNPDMRQRRPRPGGPAAFEFYSNDPYSEPLEILWRPAAAATEDNWDETILFGGSWGPEYGGSEIHDFAENYTHLFYAVPAFYYKAPDDTNIILKFTWQAQTLAYDWAHWDPIMDLSNDRRPIRLGASDTAGPGGTPSYLLTGMNFPAVMNTKLDAGTFSSWRATLTMVVSNYGPSFDVELRGEVGYVSESTTPQPGRHMTLWSPDDYYTSAGGEPSYRLMGPDGRDGRPDWCRTIAQNVTIPGGGGFQTLNIDVTPQFLEILNHTATMYGSNIVWEYGNNMGFYLRGIPSSTGQAYISGWPILTVELAKPWYLAPLNMTNIVVNNGGTFGITDDGDVHAGTLIRPAVITPYYRKWTSLAWGSDIDVYVLFGGVDSVRVLNDTWTTPGDGFAWTKRTPPVNPPGRWAHNMVEGMEGVVMFGGFDANNRPLNDLWYYYFDMSQGYAWVQLFPEDGEIPRPRGGAAMCNIGAHIALYGGTDGKTYFNDTWLLETPGSVSTNAFTEPITNSMLRWINILPGGEQSGYMGYAPSPRAFAYYNREGATMQVFGGRCGVLPTGKDTDDDWLDDGLEIDLGGPDAGRDPRANALMYESAAINTNATEKMPYAFLQFGGLCRPAPGTRWTWVADFESMSYYTNPPPPLHPDQDERYATQWGLPMEDERLFPVQPYGYLTRVPNVTTLWYHKFGSGDPLDARDVWRLGAPRGNGGDNTAPQYAHSGRWVMGTSLAGSYANNSVMELYTPWFGLGFPAVDPISSDPSNGNEYFLSFFEWLDLADSRDMVRIEAIRPVTPADAATRVSGVGKPPIVILPNRNSAANTAGEWRRVVVPLEQIANETNLYLRFVLQSDSNGVAGGWYVDDFAIVQGGLIFGTNGTPGTMYLIGIDGTNPVQQMVTGSDGSFGFDLVPAGTYRVVSGAGGAESTFVGGSSWSQWVTGFETTPIIVGIEINSPALLSWNAVAGLTYEVQVATPASIVTGTPWETLALVTAPGPVASFVDLQSDTVTSRFYRIVLKY